MSAGGSWTKRAIRPQRWQTDGHDLTMAVNISLRQLESTTLVDDVQEALNSSGIDPGMLVLEVTESVLMKDSNATVARLYQLKRLGVQIAIDDFGTGYSSLAHLRQFPADILKIDRSFVSDMSRSPDAEAFIHTMVELGHTLGLMTLAEKIEEQVQLDGLRIEQCDQGQGFYYSRPIAPSQIEELLVRIAAERAVTAHPAGRCWLGSPGFHRVRRPDVRRPDVRLTPDSSAPIARATDSGWNPRSARVPPVTPHLSAACERHPCSSTRRW
jgi:EAL domain-containing protein (putative c-di-GMP-specific phosphodiesterase class I)